MKVRTRNIGSSWIALRTRSVRLVVAVTMMGLLAACGISKENAKIAVALRTGATQADLVRQLGVPTRRASATGDAPPALCHDKPKATESYEYDFPREGLAGTIRRIARLGPTLMIVFCLDGSQRVISNDMYQFD